uniref:Putative myosin heavy chain non-muscle n=1 Tax=Lutzomyia longipalpis TaxID=7200 RepID=A0A1B0CDV3_LUTLO
MPRRRNRQKRHKVSPNDGQWCKSVGVDPLDVKNTAKCEKSDKECEYEEKPEAVRDVVSDVVRPHERDHTASLQRESNADDENRTTTRTNIISCKINTKSSCELWQSTQNTLAISLKRTAEPLGEDRDETPLQRDNVRNVVNLSGDVESVENDMMGQQQSSKKGSKAHRKVPNPEQECYQQAPYPAQPDDPHSEEYYEAHCDSFKCTSADPAITTLISPTHALSDNDSGCEFSERLREDNDIVEEETEVFHCVETTFNFNPIYNSNLVCTEDIVKSDTDRINSAFNDGTGASKPKYDMMPHINGEKPPCLPDIVGNGQTNLSENERLKEDNDIVEEETEVFHCVETTFNFNPIYNSNLVCTEDIVKSDTDRINSAFNDGTGASKPKYDMMPHINGEKPPCLPDIVGNGQTNLSEKRGLVTQEAHFSTQLDAAEKEVTYAQSKITELQLRIDELEREIANKTWAIDRLQAELVSAQKEDECVRRKLRLQEAEMGVLKSKACDREDELKQQYSDLEVTHSELQMKLKDIQHFTSNLQVQLAEAQNYAETCKKERDKLQDERVEEQKLVQDTLEAALNQRDQLEAKFEQLRNVNQEREERLMEDCEWKMRGMQKKCKERLEAITKEHQQAMETNAKLKATAEQYMKDLKRLKSIESEANALRGLTSDQRDSLTAISAQLSDVKAELEAAKVRAEQEIRNAQKIKIQCESDLIDERRKCHMKLEETRMQISMQWENKLMQEMMRLKYELESIYTDERKEALEKLKKDFEKELTDLVQKHSTVEKALRKEIADLEETLKDRIQELRDVSAKCDKQTIDARIYVDRSDRNNQLILDREIQYREELVAKLEEERNADREDMERQFSERLASVSEEFAAELCNTTEELEMKHKKALQVQYEQLMAEKDEALQALETKHKQKMSCLETKMKELEITHQRELSDMERNYSIERSTHEQRDSQHAQEIDTLHRKCRCLTKLFEEMRMRYERRDPRQEDIRQIAELKEKVEQQERDLHKLTEVLREMQIAHDLKNKMTNCDVIYEEEQESEQSVDTANGWENKLMQEMMRLKYELESIYTDERKEALEKLKKDFEKELTDLVQKHSTVEKALRKEIADLEETLKDRIQELRDVSAKCDKQTIDARIYVDRSDRNNQLILDREIQYREELVAKLEEERNADREDMERQFSERLASVSEEFAAELCNTTEELEMKHKKALQVQYEQLMAEKDEALQALETKHKQKMSCLETKMKELEITHQRELSDMERNYSIERSTHEQRDSQHAQEIDTLHRKCRCLTKLFEEMRMRYERRDPRQEDIRQIAELKEKVEQQERDLHKLTEVLREMQIAQYPEENPSTPPRKPGRNAARKNRNSDLKNKMTNCDVIYEEEQESEQSVDTANGVSVDHKNDSATEA